MSSTGETISISLHGPRSRRCRSPLTITSASKRRRPRERGRLPDRPSRPGPSRSARPPRRAGSPGRRPPQPDRGSSRASGRGRGRTRQAASARFRSRGAPRAPGGTRLPACRPERHMDRGRGGWPAAPRGGRRARSILGYTRGMKTAVSVPDDLFAQVDRLARHSRRSRSEVYSAALREYVARHAPDEVTAGSMPSSNRSARPTLTISRRPPPAGSSAPPSGDRPGRGLVGRPRPARRVGAGFRRPVGVVQGAAATRGPATGAAVVGHQQPEMGDAPGNVLLPGGRRGACPKPYGRQRLAGSVTLSRERAPSEPAASRRQPRARPGRHRRGPRPRRAGARKPTLFVSHQPTFGFGR